MDSQKNWCIAYINRDYISLANKELQQYGYDDVEAYIPTVRILKKTFKGKDEFEEIPLLFNYGFFSMPFEKACNEEFLSTLRQRVTCIYGWVKDGSKLLEKRPTLRVDNRETMIAMPRTAIATDKEISELVKASKELGIYSAEDLEAISIGSLITLHGYPFDGIPASVNHINHSKKEVSVTLELDSLMKNVTVSFDNVFYTIYRAFDEEQHDKSLTDIENNGKRSLDKIFHKLNN